MMATYERKRVFITQAESCSEILLKASREGVNVSRITEIIELPRKVQHEILITEVNELLGKYRSCEIMGMV
jgi:hypothetical protein